MRTSLVARWWDIARQRAAPRASEAAAGWLGCRRRGRGGRADDDTQRHARVFVSTLFVLKLRGGRVAALALVEHATADAIDTGDVLSATNHAVLRPAPSRRRDPLRAQDHRALGVGGAGRAG